MDAFGVHLFSQLLRERRTTTRNHFTYVVCVMRCKAATHSNRSKFINLSVCATNRNYMVYIVGQSLYHAYWMRRFVFCVITEHKTSNIAAGYYLLVRLCMRVCVCRLAQALVHTHTHAHTHNTVRRQRQQSPRECRRQSGVQRPFTTTVSVVASLDSEPVDTLPTTCCLTSRKPTHAVQTSRRVFCICGGIYYPIVYTVN